jgi:hypothetical protein
MAQIVEMASFDARATARIFVGVDYTHAVTACKKRIMMGKDLKFSNNMIKNNIVVREEKRRETYALDKACEID